MDPSDLNTHLPPRKRLLAGLRTAASAFDADPPPPSQSADLAARLRDMAVAANASSSSPDQMIEEARAAAEAAADAAAAARATAAEKAAVAARARAAARAAMEFLDSFSRNGGSSGNGLHLKVRSRKKHVQVKLLYKPNAAANGRVDGRGAALPDQDHSVGATAPLFKQELPRYGGEDSSSALGDSNAARKVKIKRKELLLNRNTTGGETEPSTHSVAPGESKLNGNAGADGSAPMKITSVWKFKKFKTSHCSSDTKVLRNVCTSPSAAETSASVKAD